MRAMQRERIAMSDELFEVVCETLASGPRSLTAVCRAKGMPTAYQVRAFSRTTPERRKRYQEARVDQSHAIFDEALDIAEELRKGRLVRNEAVVSGQSRIPWKKDDTNMVAARRVALEGLNRAAARLNPTEYGERSNAAPIVPIQIITSLPLSIGQATPDTSREGKFIVSAPILDLPSTTLPDEVSAKARGSSDARDLDGGLQDSR